MTATTGIGDVFERKHPRSGVKVKSLESVFFQLDAMSGRVTFPVVPPDDYLDLTHPEIADSRGRARRPTANDLAAFPIGSRDYGAASVYGAQSSLRRAHAQHEKGWLTDDEFAAIERRCSDVIEGVANLRRRFKQGRSNEPA